MNEFHQDPEGPVEMLHRDGYVTIPGAIDADQVAWARRELEEALGRTPTGRDDFEGHLTKRVYALFAKTRSLDSLATHPSCSECWTRFWANTSLAPLPVYP
jgi:hypothetical protein